MRNNLFIYITLLSLLILSCDDSNRKVVVCWGDSLTAPHSSVNIKGKIKNLLEGDRRYPSVLERCLGKEYNVINCGVGGESTLTIMGRQGAYPLKLAHDITIFNSNKSKFPKLIGNSDLVAFKSTYNNQQVTPLLQGGWAKNSSSCFNPCIINGLSFTIKSESNYWKEEAKYHFEYNYYIESIKKIPKTITLKKGSIVETNGMHSLRNVYANVFFMGQNGGFKDASELIEQYKAMIKYSSSNKYIIIGYHKPNGPMPNISRMIEMEDSLSNEFGEHYINLRSYLVNNGLNDANLSPEQIDKDSIMNNQVPPQLMADGIHFTPIGYELIGELIAKRFKKLGY